VGHIFERVFGVRTSTLSGFDSRNASAAPDRGRRQIELEGSARASLCHAQNIGVRPQGKPSPMPCTRRLRWRRRCPAGKYFELEFSRPTERGNALGGRSRRQAGWPPGDRKLPRRDGLSHEVRCDRVSGSNCDEDAYHAAKDVIGQQADYIWQQDTDLKGADAVILPGGFATATTFGPAPWPAFHPSCAR